MDCEMCYKEDVEVKELFMPEGYLVCPIMACKECQDKANKLVVICKEEYGKERYRS